MTLRAGVAVLMAFAGFALGCGGDDKSDPPPSVSAQLCAKAGACNFLPPGTSVQDCTDSTQLCVNGLTSSERTDWNNAVTQCVAMANCTNFLNCYAAVPGC
jgi:hypothetical protein